MSQGIVITRNTSLEVSTGGQQTKFGIQMWFCGAYLIFLLIELIATFKNQEISYIKCEFCVSFEKWKVLANWVCFHASWHLAG